VGWKVKERRGAGIEVRARGWLSETRWVYVRMRLLLSSFDKGGRRPEEVYSLD
jgi:hypothetical protein